MPDDVLERAARAPDSVERYGPRPLHVVDVYRPRPLAPVPASAVPAAAGAAADARAGAASAAFAAGVVRGAGAPDARVVLLVHGGFWRARYDRTHLRPLAEALADRGATVLLPEYRRVGDEDAAWPAPLDDVRASIDWAVHAGLAPAVVAGHSAGGHLAVLAVSPPWIAPGAEWPPRADAPTEALSREAAPADPGPRVVALAGVLDLETAHRVRYSGGAVGELLDADVPGFAERLRDADPLGRPTPSASLLLLHGTADDDVPVAQSRAYAARHPAATLVELEGRSHLDLIDPLSPAFAAVLDALGLSPRSAR
jgi:acetyl esterase/lipase